MQLRVRKFAHILERSGLALAGAACGVFVGAHVGSSIHGLTTQGFLFLMMLSGAVGFYLGIDTPGMTLHPVESGAAGGGPIDAPELLSAVGTFLATLTAFASVGLIVLRETPPIVWTVIILVGWVFGVVMQIVAGTIARSRG